MRRTRHLSKYAVVAALLAACSQTVPAEEPEPAESPGKLRAFWDEHGTNLLIALGINQAGHYYDKWVGPSTDPLFFDDPPGIDTTVRDWLRDPDPPETFLAEHGSSILLYGAPAALLAMDLTDRHNMTRDLVGYLETYLVVGGLTDLTKDVVGRERPELEFVDDIAEEDDLTPEEVEEIEESGNNRRSFPSGHASGSFAYASYLERAVARRVGMRGPGRAAVFSALYGLAGYISYSRIENDRHYFTDIVTGAALGVWVGRTYYRINHRDEFEPKQEKTSAFVFAPRPVAVPGGIAVMVEIGRRRPPRVDHLNARAQP